MKKKIAFLAVEDVGVDDLQVLATLLKKQNKYNFIITNKKIETITRKELMDVLGKLK